MKTSIIASAMILALAAAGQASANSGTITFDGQITSVTCTVTGGGNTTPGGGSGDFTVNLAPANSSELGSTGARAGRSTFSIIVGDGTSGTGCEDGEFASMGWDVSRSSVNANGQLTNNAPVGTDPATGVAVVLLNGETFAEIDLNSTSGTNVPRVRILGNTAELKFAAEYVRLADTLKEGPFSSTLRYYVNYN